MGWSSTRYSAGLSGRSSRNTKPELLLRRRLSALGLRFRLHRSILPGITPDLAFPTSRVCVYVDGCFWHGCPQHGGRQFQGPNRLLWVAKLRRNRVRDRRAVAALKSLGWMPLRIWECQVSREVEDCCQAILRLVRERSPSKRNVRPQPPTDHVCGGDVRRSKSTAAHR